MTIPTRTHPTVWHVGTLQTADKGTRGPSWEGAGLSVSDCPDAWIRIAKLGGLPTWTLTRTDRRPGHFLDIHGLDDQARTRIADWGTRNLLVEPRTVWQVTRFDDELDTDLTATFTSRQDADDEEAGDPTPVQVLTATSRLEDATGQALADGNDAFDLLATVWVEQATDLDGVWWADRHDPSRLTAPRGVIVPERLGRWEPTRAR